MSETIVVHGRDRFDPDGEIIPGSGRREIAGCVVAPSGQAKITDDGIVDGDTTTLEVVAPGGSVIREGERVVWRGVEYVVKHVPFDWSVGRRPALSRHRPRTVFTVERKEA